MEEVEELKLVVGLWSEPRMKVKSVDGLILLV